MSASRSRRSYTQDFKDELCREVISTSKPVVDVAKSCGVGSIMSTKSASYGRYGERTVADEFPARQQSTPRAGCSRGAEMLGSG